MRRRTAPAVVTLGLAAGLALAACSNEPPPAPAAPAPPASAAPTTTGMLLPGVPTQGVRPPTDRLPLAAEPQGAPAPTTPPPGRQVEVGPAPEGVVVDPVTRTVAVAKRN